jgi:type IV secretory pathway VirB3-like protein
VIYTFLTSDVSISLIIALFVSLWAYRSRDLVRRVLFEDIPRWTFIGRVTVVATALGFLWITLLDNWRQLLGYYLQASLRYRADPLEAAAVSDGVRAVTIALVGCSVIGVAMLYARHRGAYVLLVVSLLFAPLYAYVFNEVRMRADMFLRNSEAALASGDAVDIGFVLFWSGGLLIIIATIIVASYFFLFALMGIPVRVIYALVTRHEQPEVSGVFRFYERHASGPPREPSQETDPSSGLNQDARPG